MAVLGGTRSPLVDVCWTVLACMMMVDGALWFYPGPCPEGKVKGDSWPHEKFECTSCTCLGVGNGYRCASCGVVSLLLPHPSCYVFKPNADAPYPACCIKRLSCPGVEVYDSSKANPPNTVKK